MRNIFIIHGSYGHPEENWFPWLKSELEELNCNVIVPKFPIHSNTKHDHRINEWLKKMEQYMNYINEETIFVAHSRGNVFLYRFFMKYPVQVKATYLVAPWIYWKTSLWSSDPTIIDSFHNKSFEWDKIRNRSSYFEIFQSMNDVIPVTEGKELAQNLNAKLILVKNAGHFNITTYKKFKKFPYLLERIKLRL
ncbi:alpha/beta hydrolase [Candidatus Roizmanbacteria bacterium]|nr:alpha/beta hydrolase [Candidatus Roizmanbacteria bacterium]